MPKEQFQKTVWYRLLKVIYIAAYIFVLVFGLIIVWDATSGPVSNYDIAERMIKDYPNKYGRSLYDSYSLPVKIGGGEIPLTTVRLTREQLERENLYTKIWSFSLSVFIIWLFFLVIKRIFSYIAFDEKFLRFPKRIFD